MAPQKTEEHPNSRDSSKSYLVRKYALLKKYQQEYL